MARGKHAKKSQNSWIIVLLIVAIIGAVLFFGWEKIFSKNNSKDEGIAIEVPASSQGDADEEAEIVYPYGVDPTKPMIALTFEDGPSQYTWDIVKTLAEYRSRGTFFMVGNRVSTHQAAINNVLDNHNEIGNHSFDDKDLTKLNRDEVWAQVENGDWILWQEHNYYCTLMRAPYGATNETVLSVLKEKNHPNITWSIDANDQNNKDKEIIANTVLTNVKDGDIIRLHDMSQSTADAIALMVPQLIEQGYQLVTVSELMEYKGISLESGETYSSANL